MSQENDTVQCGEQNATIVDRQNVTIVEVVANPADLPEITSPTDLGEVTGTETHVDVIASLVEFSKVISETIVELQKNFGRVLHCVDVQNNEIAKLQTTVSELQTTVEELAARNPSTSRDPPEPTGVTLDSVLRDVDGLRATDEYDSLLEKMNARKAAIKMVPSQCDAPEMKQKTQKEIDIENARTLILERARQHAQVNMHTHA